MTPQQVRRRTDRLRSIPLVQVLLAAGAHQDPRDKIKWHCSQGVLSVTGTKFFNWNQHLGGGGAIDLAMHLNTLRFKDAILWIEHRFPCPSSAPGSSPPVNRPPALPTPAAHHLPTVNRYLTQQRLLPSDLLGSLIDAGLLYADARANAVFLLLGKENAPTGAELRGTGPRPWRGMARGSRKNLGYFRTGPQYPTAIVLCESAIDTISYRALHPNWLCISTSGARPEPAWLPALIQHGRPVYCGFDADPTGDRMAQAMIALHPAIQRIRPPAHDWNDALRACR